MATSHLRGSASITYTPPGGSETTHLLGVRLSPVREFVPALLKERHDWWAVDRATREVVTIGDGVDELVCTIRVDNEPTALRTMLQHGLEDDVVLTYQEDESADEIPLRLVEIMGAQPDEVPLTPDRGRYGGGEYEVPIRVRRTDGGTLESLL